MCELFQKWSWLLLNICLKLHILYTNYLLVGGNFMFFRKLGKHVPSVPPEGLCLCRRGQCMIDCAAEAVN